jgi:hypothetical protein
MGWSVKIFCMALLSAISARGESPLPNRAPSSYLPAMVVDSKEINLKQLEELEKMVDEHYRFKPDNYIPLNLPEYSSDGRVILGKVLQRSLQTWADSTKEKGNRLSHAEFAKNHLNTKSQEFLLPQGQKVELRVRPVNAMVMVRMRGPIDGSISYFAAEQTANTEFTREWDRKTLYLNRIDNYLGYATTLGIRWSY